MNDQNSHDDGKPPVQQVGTPVRADLHCHSAASEVAKLGVQRALALPECATPPEEVYELAKRRAMDFVTITDHDTIDGVLELADRPDVFTSEELTAWFKDEPQAVHILCFGITPDDHDWLQAHSSDVIICAEYLQSTGITCALAHPFFHVAAPLSAAHRRTLAELFPIWETRNGAPARELNAPAVVYIETHGGIRGLRLGRSRRGRCRSHLHRGSARRHAGSVPGPHSCRARLRRRDAGQRGEVGPATARPRPLHRSTRCARAGRADHDRRGRTGRGCGLGTRTRGWPAPAAVLAGREGTGRQAENSCTAA